MATDPVPATSSSLIPMLVCRNVGAELEFCTKVSDTVEVGRGPGPDGNVVHALIKRRHTSPANTGDSSMGNPESHT